MKNYKYSLIRVWMSTKSLEKHSLKLVFTACKIKYLLKHSILSLTIKHNALVLCNSNLMIQDV